MKLPTIKQMVTTAKWDFTRPSRKKIIATLEELEKDPLVGKLVAAAMVYFSCISQVFCYTDDDGAAGCYDVDYGPSTPLDKIWEFITWITPKDGKLCLTIACKDYLDDCTGFEKVGADILTELFTLCVRPIRKGERAATQKDIIELLDLVGRYDCGSADLDFPSLNDSEYHQRKAALMNKFKISRKYIPRHEREGN